jgi:threonine dehydratase
VKRVGAETFRLARHLVDDWIVVDTDAACAAIKDVFEDTRSILEPAGALGVAAIKQHVQRHRTRGETYVAITCGANMNFDRLRFVAERAEFGEEREALFAVTIPEERGSFRRFCELIGPRAVTEFNYRIADARVAHVFVGIATVDRPNRHGLPSTFRSTASRPSTSPATTSPRSTCATWSGVAAPWRTTSGSIDSSSPSDPAP